MELSNLRPAEGSKHFIQTVQQAVPAQQRKFQKSYQFVQYLYLEILSRLK